MKRSQCRALKTASSGVVMNADVQAVVIRDNFRFQNPQFDAPPPARLICSSIFLWKPRLDGAEESRSSSRPGYSEDSGPSWDVYLII